MSTLLYQGERQSEWLGLIQLAEQQAKVHLPILLEQYLSSLLLRFTTQPDIAGSVLAEDYLHAAQLSGAAKRFAMLEVAEKCLLFTGLFPARAEKRLVNIRYWTDMGRTAYQQLAVATQEALSEFYETLAHEFVTLMTVLIACRQHPWLEPNISIIDAYSLWELEPCKALFLQLGYPLPTALVLGHASNRLH